MSGFAPVTPNPFLPSYPTGLADWNQKRNQKDTGGRLEGQDCVRLTQKVSAQRLKYF
jgi:hypothetical protein